MIYNYDLPDGGDIVGTGPEVGFVPPESRYEPHQVNVFVTSDLTHIASNVESINIYTEAAHDYDGDDDIDGEDLAEFSGNFDHGRAKICSGSLVIKLHFGDLKHVFWATNRG